MLSTITKPVGQAASTLLAELQTPNGLNAEETVAAASLGYANPRVGHYSDARELLSVLEMLKINVFNDREVGRYKHQMKRRLEFKLRQRVRIALAALVIDVLVGLRLLFAGSFTAALVAVVVGFVLYCVTCRCAHARNNSRAEWNLVHITKYSQPMPADALNAAAAITGLLPGAMFLIDELQLNAVPKDPFLKVQLGPLASFYIAVWDEPGFTARSLA